MKIYIETERLYLRGWTRDDLVPFIKMNNDPRVMEFFVRRLTKTESSEFFTRIRDELDTSGFGLFAVEEQNTGRFIGFVGLHRFDFGNDFATGVEIAWRLVADAWGKGYATEAASACLVYARQVFGIKEIYAFTSTLNERSERVMKKIGMRFIKTFDHPSVPCGHPLVPHKLYCTVRPDSRRRSLFAPATGTTHADRSDAVAIFVNGYWNTGRTALKIGSIFSHRLGVEMHEAIIQNIGDVPLEGYWEAGFIAKAKSYFRRRFKSLKGKTIRSVSPIFVDGSGDWYSSGKSRFADGETYGREILSQELTDMGVTDENGVQRKNIFIVSHSMGGAYAEGIVRYLVANRLKVDSVMHFSAADNKDFSVGLPAVTYQINIVPDPVLMYKNLPDRITVHAENLWESIKERISGAGQREKPDAYQIVNMLRNHYIEHDGGMDLLNHYYTKASKVWKAVPFLNDSGDIPGIIRNSR